MVKYKYKKGWWETKDHKNIKIKDMETSHIENTIDMLKRNPKFYDEEYAIYDAFDVDGNFYDYISNTDLVDAKIDELEFELKIRKLQENINTYCGEYGTLESILEETLWLILDILKELKGSDNSD